MRKLNYVFCSDEKGIVWRLVADMSFTVCRITFVLVCLTESDAELVDWFRGISFVVTEILSCNLLYLTKQYT